MTITALTDAELLDQARHGDEAAFTELYVRHQPAALRLARTYKRLGDPDDLVNGAFERVLTALRRGSGPTESFRAYLFVTLRRLAGETAGGSTDESLDQVPEPIIEVADSPELAAADRELITEAFESLPDRWQAVLWHTAVEGRQPRELAGALGVSANAAAAMAYRAREKLRQAYLQAHLLATPAPEHLPYREQLGAYVRDGLSTRDREAVEKHLEDCESCRALLAELQDVNRTLTRSVLPLFLLVGGKEVGALLAGSAAAGGAAAGEGGGKSLFSKVRQAAPAVGSSVAIAALIAGIAGMGRVVAREDPGPLDSAADVADLGPDGSGSSNGSGGDGDSLFGDDDFALSPFDDDRADLGPLGDNLDSFGDDFDGFGDGFGGGTGFGDDFDGFDGFGDGFGGGSDDFGNNSGSPSRVGSSGSPRPSGGTPPPSTSPPPSTTPPPTTKPPPTKPPPTTPPPTTTPPAPLAIASAAWVPSGLGTGTLSFDIAEAAAAQAATTLAASQTQAAPAPLTLEVTLSGGATFAASPGAGCQTAGAGVARCTFTQPTARGTVPTITLDVEAVRQGAQATARILRGTTVEARRGIDLAAYESGLTVAYGTWTPDAAADTSSSTVGAESAGTGTLTVNVNQANSWDVAGVTLVVDVSGAVALDPAGSSTGCTQGAAGTPITCTLATVPGGGAVTVELQLNVTGEGQHAQALRLELGGTVVARLDKRVELTPRP
jgi:RNA polymerase sigma factor (sigma-70 family)